MIMTVNCLQANIYADLVDWNAVDKTEPPLTMDMSAESVMTAFTAPLHLPSYPNQTQVVEQFMPVLEQACGLIFVQYFVPLRAHNSETGTENDLECDK